jgi:hypothetical protein
VIFVLYYSYGNFHHEQKNFFSLFFFFSHFNKLVHRSVQYSTDLDISVKCVRDPANTVKYMRSGGLLYTVYRVLYASPVLYCAVMFHHVQVRELQSQFPAGKELSYCL